MEVVEVLDWKLKWGYAKSRARTIHGDVVTWSYLYIGDGSKSLPREPEIKRAIIDILVEKRLIFRYSLL
jgi:hypothetical protein